MVLRRSLVAVAMTAALAAGQAQGAVVYQTGPLLGNQDWSGSLGLDFTVNQPGVVVSALGAFDSGGNGIVGPVTVQMFDVTLGTPVGPSAVFTGALHTDPTSAYILKAVTPFALTSGHLYTIEAWGFSSSDLNFNSFLVGGFLTPITFDSLGGALTNGLSRFDGSINVIGTDIWQQNGFGAGTFATSIPEPGTWALFGLSLAGLGLRLRRPKAR